MLKAPTTFRETMLLFGRMNAQFDVPELFAQVDWSGVTRRQLTHAFLDRPPANAAEAHEEPGFNAQTAALALFAAPEFRDGIATRLLRGFPAKKRFLFVHLPKAAGTDFKAAMRQVLPCSDNALGEPELVSQLKLAERLRQFGRIIQPSDTIFMGGHISLSWFLDENLFRFGDRMATVVRHPYEICVSMANYIVHRFDLNPDLSAPDTRGWAGVLRLTREDIAKMDRQVLALALVARANIMPVNPICRLLGDGTAQGTLDTLSRAPIEITSIERYSEWLRQNWSLDRKQRGNASPQRIAWNDLSAWQKGQIIEACHEDKIVYEAVMARLSRTDALSVTGPEVA
jgi:hypothetical protein